MFHWILEFLAEYSVELGGGAAVVALVETVFKPFRSIAARFKKPEKVELANPDALKETLKDARGDTLDVFAFLRIQKHLKAELEKELGLTHTEEKDRLRAWIAELEARIADPERALAEAQARIAELEALLERSGNEIGGDRLLAAREALEQGDSTLADAIFAEVEARRDMDVKEAARAAFGRGLIAEEQVRWRDAADHFAKAARLDPGYDTLLNAGNMLWRAGRYADAISCEEQLVKVAEKEFGAQDAKTATALNNLAESYRAKGRYAEAEPLYRQALEIDRKALGEEHADFAGSLNNLGLLLRATGRSAEAEPLYRQALEITRKAL